MRSFGFKKEIEKEKTYKYLHGNGKEEYYTETLWKYDNEINTIEILEKRENSDWRHPNEEKEVYIYENDYDMGISKHTLDTLYDLIKADMVVKE